MPTRAGSEIAKVTISEIRQSSGPSAKALSPMAASGTTKRERRDTQHAAGEQRAGRDRHEARRMRHQPRHHVETDQECHQTKIHPEVGVRFVRLCIAVKSLCASCSPLHSTFFGPFGDDSGERVEPVGERRRAGLQDQRRLDLAQPAGGDRRNPRKTRPGGDLGRHEFLAAPGADDDVGLRARSPRRPTRCGPWRSCARQAAGNTSMPPAASISSDTQPRPEIIGSSHSSK